MTFQGCAPALPLTEVSNKAAFDVLSGVRTINIGDNLVTRTPDDRLRPTTVLTASLTNHLDSKPDQASSSAYSCCIKLAVQWSSFSTCSRLSSPVFLWAHWICKCIWKWPAKNNRRPLNLRMQPFFLFGMLIVMLHACAAQASVSHAPKARFLTKAAQIWAQLGDKD